VATDILVPKRVYLTGCSGEIGSRLTSLLVEKGYEVFGIKGKKACYVINPRHTCIKLDLLDPSINLKIMEFKPDILVHTAWLTTANDFWESSQNIEWLAASKRIITDFHLSGGSYVIVTGSCAEYSWNIPGTLSENSLEKPSTIYGKAKIELLNWMRSQDFPFLWTRTFFQFGMNELDGRLIPSVIDSLVLGNEFIVRNPEDVRDFVFIDDVVKLLALLVFNEAVGVVNIGSGVAHEVRVITEKIGKLLGREDLLKFNDDKITKSKVVSNPEKLKSLTGTFYWTPTEVALVRSIEARKH
jgi:nucleoside-diphosphate-sugar epimerase